MDIVESFIVNIQRFTLSIGDYWIPGAQPPAGDVTPPPNDGGVVDLTPTGGGDTGVGFDWWMFVLWGAIIVGMYMILFRPQRKREKKMREMQAAIKAGDNIVTSSGMFGKVMEVGTDAFVVEFGTNRGIRIPILKSDVVGIREPKLTPPPAAS